MNIKRFVVAVALGCVSIVAQSRAFRTLTNQSLADRAEYSASGVGEPASLEFVVTPSGELTTQGPDSTAFSPAVVAELQAVPGLSSISSTTRAPRMRRVQTGVLVPGDYCVWSNDLDMLVCGSGSNGGRLEYWSIDSVTDDLVLRSGRDYPGMHFTGVGFDATSSRLFLLDSVGKNILEGVWAPLAALPDAMTLVLFASEAEFAGLAQAGSSYIRYVHAGNGTIPAGAQGRVFLGNDLFRATAGTLMSRVGGLLVTESGNWWSRRALSGPAALHRLASEGDVSVVVRGDSGEVVAVSDLQQGAVVGAAVVPIGADTVAVSLTAPLVLGRSYEVSYPALPGRKPTVFECVARYGVPETTVDGLAFQTRYAERDAFVGNESFSILSYLRMQPAPAVGTDLVGLWMLGAFRDATGQDPIILDPLDGDGLVVVPISILDAYGFIGKRGHGFMMLEMAVPNDPGLVGEVLITQFAALDSVGLKFSEAIGLRLREAQ